MVKKTEETAQLETAKEEVKESLSDREVALIASIVEEMKKPYVDPIKEEQRKRYRRDLQHEEQQRIEQERAFQAACPHLREDNTSTFFWNPLPPMNQWGVPTSEVGVCCRCMKLVHSKNEDGTINREYQTLRRIPTGKVSM